MSSYYPNPFQTSSTGGSLPQFPPSGGPNQNPPPKNGKYIQPSPQQRRRTCGRCRINYLPCDGGNPCQWCAQAGEPVWCKYAPSPDMGPHAQLSIQPPPPPPPFPVAGPAVASPTPLPPRFTPQGITPPPYPRQGVRSPPHRPQSTVNTPPRQSPGNGSGSGSPSSSGRGSGSPRPRPYEFRPGVLIGDRRPLAPVATPSPAPVPAVSPAEAARIERARRLNLPPSRQSGGPAYADHPPSGTEWTGEEEELARIEREHQSESPFFDDAIAATETSRAVEAVEKDRKGEMDRNWARKTRKE